MGYKYNNTPNIREILRYTPAGTKLYSPVFGTLYLTHEGHGLSSSISKYEIGDIEYTTLTKKEPPYPICQFGGQGQYRYKDIDYLFDEHGNVIVYNHHKIDYNKPILKEGWNYTYNGYTFISNEGCQLFPDEECTWKDWQIKLFKKGDLVKIKLSDRNNDPVWQKVYADYYNPNKERNYVGYFVDSFKDCYGNHRLILSDTVMETVIDRTHKHYYVGHQEIELTENTFFATNQDRMEYCNNKDILLGRKKPETILPYLWNSDSIK